MGWQTVARVLGLQSIIGRAVGNTGSGFPLLILSTYKVAGVLFSVFIFIQYSFLALG